MFSTDSANRAEREHVYRMPAKQGLSRTGTGAPIIEMDLGSFTDHETSSMGRLYGSAAAIRCVLREDWEMLGGCFHFGGGSWCVQTASFPSIPPLFTWSKPLPHS